MCKSIFFRWTSICFQIPANSNSTFNNSWISNKNSTSNSNLTSNNNWYQIRVRIVIWLLIVTRLLIIIRNWIVIRHQSFDPVNEGHILTEKRIALMGHKLSHSLKKKWFAKLVKRDKLRNKARSEMMSFWPYYRKHFVKPQSQKSYQFLVMMGISV